MWLFWFFENERRPWLLALRRAVRGGRVGPVDGRGLLFGGQQVVNECGDILDGEC